VIRKAWKISEAEIDSSQVDAIDVFHFYFKIDCFAAAKGRLDRRIYGSDFDMIFKLGGDIYLDS